MPGSGAHKRLVTPVVVRDSGFRDRIPTLSGDVEPVRFRAGRPVLTMLEGPAVGEAPSSRVPSNGSSCPSSVRARKRMSPSHVTVTLTIPPPGFLEGTVRDRRATARPLRLSSDPCRTPT